MSTTRERGARYLYKSDRPLTMRQRRLYALAGAFSVIVVVLQVVHGAWVQAVCWTVLSVIWIATVAIDARRWAHGGR